MSSYFLFEFFDKIDKIHIFKDNHEMYHKVILRFFLITLLCLSMEVSFASPVQNFYTLTLSIMSYSKLSTGSNTTLCVIDNPAAAGIFQTQIKQSTYGYKVQSIPAASFVKTQCQAVYFSSQTPAQQEVLINSYPSHSLLSFSANNIDCEIGSIFCLYQQKGKSTFKVNLDTLSRSQVRIDPRVLLLAKNAE
nr:YfiR family protein [Acinetobacter soli]